MYKGSSQTWHSIWSSQTWHSLIPLLYNILMNQFRVECSEVNYFTVLVEANSEDEARKLAHADINSFPVDNEFVSEWTIEEVTEV